MEALCLNKVTSKVAEYWTCIEPKNILDETILCVYKEISTWLVRFLVIKLYKTHKKAIPSIECSLVIDLGLTGIFFK